MTAGTASAGTASAQQAPPSLEPYKGLAPYLESDSDLFFGREREIEIICANLMAARLTLLYGESGVGKSSVLMAGAVHQLREEARRNLDEYGRAEFLVVAYRSWRDDPVQGLIVEIRRALEELCGGDAALRLPEHGGLVDVIRAATECVDGDVIVVLDQFDEYFLYHGTEDGAGTFAVEFPRAVNQEDLRTSFLVSMREDTVAKLDRFKGRIPILFDNRLRIDHLGIEAAREAIERPLEAYNEQRDAHAAIEIEPELVDRILSEITGRSVALAQVGARDVGRGSPSLVDDRIQAPYLQVVLRRLWLEEVKAGSQVLRAGTLERLGGCESIVRTRLAELMDALEPEERDVAAAVFRFLVTRSGAKVAHTASDLADFSGLPVENVASVLEHMAAPDVRLLRSVEAAAGDDGGTSFEIAHDVIGPAILNWRAHYEQEGRVRKERRRTRIAVGVAAVSLLGCIAVAVLAVWAVRSEQRASDARKEARAQELSARAQELAARARAASTDDPVRAVTLALEALKASENTEQAEAVLREALPELRVRRIVEGVGDPLAAAISGEGRALLALAAEDQGARLVDAETGESVPLLGGSEDSVISSSFNADGSRLATASSDGTASLWDATTGEEIASLAGGDGVSLVAFDPSGRYVVGADYSGLLYLWSGESGAALGRARGGYEGAYVWRLSFSGDGSRLATVSDDGLEVHLFAVSAAGLRAEGQLETARAVPPAPMVSNGPPTVSGSMRPSGLGGAIASAELNPKGSLLLTADMSGRVQLWNAATLAPVRTFSGGSGDTLDLAFSPQGNLVAAAQQKLVRIWRTANVEPLAELRGHEDWVNAVEFRADGENVLSASSDGTARVWEARTGVPVLELNGHLGPVSQAGYLPGDAQVATVSEDGTARVWDVGTGAELRGHSDWVMDATPSADGTRLATVGADGRLIWWNPETRARLDDVLVDFNSDPVTSVEISPDGNTILTAGTDGFADLWEAADLEYVAGASDHEGLVQSASFNPTGNRIVTAGWDRTARVWDPADLDAALFTLEQGDQQLTHEGAVYDAAFSPGDGSRIVTVGDDEVARVWSSEDGRLLGEFEGHDARVWSVSFDPVDPTLVVTGSPDRTARIWNIETRVEVARLTQPESVTTAAFSPDGELIVTGSPGGVTRIWDWRSEKLLAAMRMHGDYVNSAEFAPDGRIVTASDDRTAKIYPCETCVGLEALVKLAEARLAELGRPATP